MKFTTQWRAAFRVKSFTAAVIRRQWLERGGGGGRGCWLPNVPATCERGEGGELVIGDHRSLVEEPCRRNVDILGWGEVLFG